MFSLIKGNWDILLTEDLDYVNFTHLSQENDLCLKTWKLNQTTRAIIKHLEDLGLNPAYVFEGHMFVRLELLHTILSPAFMCSETPDLPDFFIRDLLDLKISQARDRMDGDPPSINSRERRLTAVRKVDNVNFLLDESEERQRVLEGLQEFLDAVRSPSKVVDPESWWKYIDARMLEVSYTVREISSLIIALRQVGTKAKERAKAVDEVREKLKDINSAISCEVLIRKTQYRMILSQLMIHEAFTMSAEASTKNL